MKNNLIFKSKPEISPLVVGIIAILSVSILLYDIFQMFLLSFFFFTFGELLFISLKTDFYFFENYFLIKKIYDNPQRIGYEQIARVTLNGRGDIRFDSDPKLLFHLKNKKTIKVVVNDDEKLIQFLRFLNDELKIRIDVDSNIIGHDVLIFNENLQKEGNPTEKF
jgi:hypothetical protein